MPVLSYRQPCSAPGCKNWVASEIPQVKKVRVIHPDDKTREGHIYDVCDTCYETLPNGDDIVAIPNS